ncbi:Zinc finger BED domain-containing-like protein [Daphnia magna]|uniref:Zinc finger BED domain-containing-like protein n=1 Tax=Daphnia magna TaxID=35525 RepID=A0A164ERG0_9CRUS|nr:Zinc finger BED domain-containing-like protein [Daphnia magna]
MIKSVQLFLDGDEGKEDIDFDELDKNNDEEKEELVINELSESICDIVRGFRWNPTLVMLARLLELRDFITETENSRADLKISEIQWMGIQGISSVLGPAQKASVRLQMEQLTIGDFY